MKVLKGLTKEHKDALKFVLENVNPTDTRVIITVRDLRQIDKICKVIEGSEDSIELEDADFNYLKSKFDGFTGWNPTQDTRNLIMEVSDKLSKE